MPSVSDSDSAAKSRTIAIVGRPNVGKSALFNRMVGRRMAIVHSESGVTRDRLSCPANWHGHPFELVDTGGIGTVDDARSPDGFDAAIRQQVETALTDAAAAIFVVDLQSGLMPLDREVARLLHDSGMPVRLAANKADHDALDLQAVEFAELGFPAVPVSARQGRGLEALLEPLLETLPPAEDTTESAPLRLAFVGRPNAGKSSLINRILRTDRVIVSELPGTTRDSIEIPFTTGHGQDLRHYVLIDTAGLRKTRKVKDAVEHFSVMRAEQSVRRCDIAVLVLDAMQGPRRRDKAIAAQVLEQRRGCILAVTKWDLVSERTQRSYQRALHEALPFLHFAPVIFTSAEDGLNVRRLMQAVDYVGEQVDARLGTGLLNRVLQEAVTQTPPAGVGGKRLKLYYATQVGTRPVTLRLFVNDAKRVPRNYPAYLEKALRRAFGLEGAPLNLQFRTRTRQA